MTAVTNITGPLLLYLTVLELEIKHKTKLQTKKVISILNLEHWAAWTGAWQTMHEVKSIGFDEAFNLDVFQINQKR